MSIQEDQSGSIKPYLVRAIHEWCTDQGLTPYLAVQVDQRTRVPREYVREGQIVLNLGMEATHQLSISNELITFQARFNGVAQHLSIPVGNVTAIYARENGQGMAFDVTLQNEEAVSLVESKEPTPISSLEDRNVMDTEPSESSPPARRPVKPTTTDRPHLTRIK